MADPACGECGKLILSGFDRRSPELRPDWLLEPSSKGFNDKRTDRPETI